MRLCSSWNPYIHFKINSQTVSPKFKGDTVFFYSTNFKEYRALSIHIYNSQVGFIAQLPFQTRLHKYGKLTAGRSPPFLTF